MEALSNMVIWLPHGVYPCGTGERSAKHGGMAYEKVNLEEFTNQEAVGIDPLLLRVETAGGAHLLFLRFGHVDSRLGRLGMAGERQAIAHTSGYFYRSRFRREMPLRLFPAVAEADGVL